MSRLSPFSPAPAGASGPTEPGFADGRFGDVVELATGNGVVNRLGVSYRAFDRRTSRRVIIRFLGDVDPVKLYHLREPVARLRQIFHESLAPVLEARLAGDQPFWIRDHVAGVPFVDALGEALQAGEQRRAVAWVQQILGGLDVLARYGIAHGRLSAANLRLVDGRAVLLDYGLRPGGAEQDLHALAAILSKTASGVTGEVSELWEQLHNPMSTAGSPRTALHRLVTEFNPLPAASPILLDRPFVGRETELTRIHRSAMRTRRGQSVTLLVEGPPGIGRSALLAKSKRLIESQHDDAMVLAAGCHRPTRPGGAMEALLEDLLGRLERLQQREVEVVLPARPRELALDFPLFLRLESVALAAPALEERAESRRDRAVAALRQLFDRVAERRPVVLILDGAERADVLSLEILRRILEPPDPPPMMLLIGLDQRAPRSEALDRLITPHVHKTASSKVERLTLQPLDPRDGRWMTRTLIGAEAPQDLVEEIANSARGLPSWIVRLVDDALDADLAKSTEPMPASLRAAALSRRLAALSPAATQLLRCLSLISRPISPAIARRFASFDGGAFEHVVDQLLAEDLIRHSVSGDAFTVTDGLVVETVLELAADAESLHAHVAQVLAESGAAPEELAHHWRAAGNFARAGDAAKAGAIRAMERGQAEAAAELWRLALDDIDPKSPDRLPLLRQLAKALDRTGDFALSSQAYLEASELAPEDALDLRRLAADRCLVNGDQKAGLQLLEPLLQRTGLRPLIGQGQGLSDRMYGLWRGLRRALGPQRWRRTNAADLLAVDVAWTLCRGLRIADPGKAEELSREHLTRAMRSKEPFRQCRALALETAHQAYGGWRRRARVEKLGRRAISLARQLDQPRARGLAEVMAGEAWLLLGEWRRALSAIDRGLLILESECPEAWWERRVALFQQLRCLAMLGKLSDISYLIGESQRRETVTRAPFLRHAVESRFGWLVAISEDRPGDASKVLEERRRVPSFSDQPSYWQLYGEVEVAIYRSDVHYAWHHLEEFWSPVVLPRLANIEFLRIEAWHQRARAALAALAMRPNGNEAPALRQAAEQALGVLERISSPWSDAVALRVRAGLESVAGDRYAAAATLQRAESRLDHLDMASLVQSARRQRALLVPSAVANDRLADADRRLSECGVAAPASMANLLVPGRWTVPPSDGP